MASIISIQGRWRASVRLAGHKPQHKTFDKKSEAKAWADSLEHQLRNNQPTEGSSYTVTQLIDEYRRLRRLAQRPIEKTSNTFFMLRHLEQGFGSKKAASLTVQDYTNWVETRLTFGGGKVALGMELNCLKTVYKKSCLSLGITLPPHLDAAIELLTSMDVVNAIAKQRTRLITDEEHMTLYLNFKNDLYRDVYEMVYTLSLRPSEVLNLIWSDYYMEEGNPMLLVRDRKHPKKKKGNHSRIPLLFNSWEIIERQRKEGQEPTDKIFGGVTVENVSDAFGQICTDKLIEDCRLYDARHTAITRFFNLGLPIERVALISGHKDWRHLQRYTHLNPADLHSLPQLQNSL